MKQPIRTGNFPIRLCHLAVGLVFLSEGLQKYIIPDAAGVERFTKIGFSNLSFWAYFTGSSEITSSLMVLMGLLTRFAAIPLLVIMIVAFITTKVPKVAHQRFWSFSHDYRTGFAMALLLIFVLIYGGENYSVDKKLTHT